MRDKENKWYAGVSNRIVQIFTEIHWLLLNIVTTVIAAFIVQVHRCLYACVIGVYTHVWSHDVTAVCTSRSLWKYILATGGWFRAAGARHLGELNKEFWYRETSDLQNCFPRTFHQFGRLQGRSATRSLLCILVRPSVNCPTIASPDHAEISQLKGDSVSVATFSYTQIHTRRVPLR